MDIIIENAKLIAAVFLIIFGLYLAEFHIRRFGKREGNGRSRGSVILTTVFSVVAIALNIGICTFLLLKGADIGDVLPILLLSLLETLL